MKYHNFWDWKIPEKEWIFGTNSNLEITEENRPELIKWYIVISYRLGGELELLWLRDVNPELKDLITDYLNDPVGTFMNWYDKPVAWAKSEVYGTEEIAEKDLHESVGPP